MELHINLITQNKHFLYLNERRFSRRGGFNVAISGDIMTMPGLPKVPSAEKIDVDDEGRTRGLF